MCPSASPLTVSPVMASPLTVSQVMVSPVTSL